MGKQVNLIWFAEWSEQLEKKTFPPFWKMIDVVKMT